MTVLKGDSDNFPKSWADEKLDMIYMAREVKIPFSMSFIKQTLHLLSDLLDLLDQHIGYDLLHTTQQRS